MFGIRDQKTRERLLRESDLTLKRMDEICHAAESMSAQLKVVEDNSSSAVVSAVDRPTRRQEGGANAKCGKECWNCGRRHDFQRRESCPAYGKTCSKCHKPNHFAVKCRGKNSPSVHTATGGEESGNADEVFQMHTTPTSLDNSQLLTLRLESGNHIRFQVDTGAQSNVVPLDVYKKATKDIRLEQVAPSQTHITAYGGTTLPVVGTVLLRVWRGDFHCRLDWKLVDRLDIRPLLGRKAYLGMRIVSYIDNDQLNRPQTGDAAAYAVEGPVPLSTEQLIKKFPDVFSGGISLLEGPARITSASMRVSCQFSMHLDVSQFLYVMHFSAHCRT